MYVLDTNAFYSLGSYYPSRFPTIWKRIDELVNMKEFWSVREVRREIEINCPYENISNWVRSNIKVFRTPTSRELEIVSLIFQRKQFLGLVKRRNILLGLPVADPFIVAAAKVLNGSVVTQEIFKEGGARIPTVCREFDVECINMERFLEREELEY